MIVPGMVAAAYAAPAAPPAGGAIGWNFRKTLGHATDGPIDLFCDDTFKWPLGGAAPSWTNGNGVSIDAGWFSDGTVNKGYPVGGIYTRDLSPAGSADPRIQGTVQTEWYGAYLYWRIAAPAGTHRLWLGTGHDTQSSMQFTVWDGIDEGQAIDAVGVTQIFQATGRNYWDEAWMYRHSPINPPADPWSDVDWVSNYAAQYIDLVITNQGANTGMLLKFATLPGSGIATAMTHIRIEEQ